MNLTTPVQEVERIGPAYVKRLERLGILKVKDLLFHFPSRYEDYSNIVNIKDLQKGQMVTVEGKIIHSSERFAKTRRLKIIEAIIEDRSGSTKAIWFNQSYIKNILEPGTRLLLSGKVSLGKGGIYLNNPIYEIPREDRAPVHTGRIVPIYPETRGISSRWLRYIISKLLPLAENMEDYMPDSILKENNLPSLRESLYHIHFPPNSQAKEIARYRFQFEELFKIQLAALKTKLRMQKENSPKIKTNVELTKKFIKSLPYTLTDSQKKSAWQILKDMEKNIPMNRLLEGDVGSGKTVVAAIAIVNVLNNNYQAALMAPTEILAEQHFETFKKLLIDQNTTIGLYTRNHRKIYSTNAPTDKKTPADKKIAKNKEVEQISKEKIKKNISEGSINLIIGTHTLSQEKVTFKKLGLIIIDEQHRFGVGQRSALVKKDIKTKGIPHLLSMTATPIPRSLALTIYGNLDISLLKEMPPGRKKIITKIISPKQRPHAYKFIQKELDKGRQAFVIFPLIEASEKLQSKSAIEEYKKLSTGPFKNYNIELLHGKIKAKEKERIMRELKENKINILISTSVIEVGIDIQNATIMMVDGAERFGLAQLHQFRGRVGRDKHQSYFFALTDSMSPNTLSRLNALREAKNGFELAEHDLALRGAGDMYGVRQSGMPDLAMASLGDIKLIEKTRTSANIILEKDATLESWPKLKEQVERIQILMHFE